MQIALKKDGRDAAAPNDEVDDDDETLNMSQLARLWHDNSVLCVVGTVCFLKYMVDQG